MSRDDREGDPEDRTRIVGCVADGSTCARIERGMRLSLAQCAQLMLMPDVVWDRGFGSRCASCVAMMQPADHRESDDLPSIYGLALAG